MDTISLCMSRQASLPLPIDREVNFQHSKTSRTLSQSSAAADLRVRRSVENNDGGGNGENGDDDDVQVIFSVPRRRRKKRRRLHLSNLAVTQGQQPRRHDGHSLASRGSHSSAQARPNCLTVSEPVQSNQALTERRVPVGTHISSIGSPVFESPSKVQAASRVPVFGRNHTLDLQPLPNSWWESSDTGTRGGLDHDFGWEPIHVDSGISKKRWHHRDWEMPPGQRFHYRHSTQISPRTNPAPKFAPSECSSNGIGFNSQNTIGGSNDTSSSPTTWPSFDWNSFNDANTNSFISQSLQQAATLIKCSPQGRNCSNKIPQHAYAIRDQFEPMDTASSWGQNESLRAVEINEEENAPATSSIVEAQARYNKSQDVSLNDSLPKFIVQEKTNAAVVHPQPQKESQRLQSTIVPDTDNLVQTFEDVDSTLDFLSLARPPDIVRKPSLYKIPPWLPSLTSNPPSTKSFSDQANGYQPSESMSLFTSKPSNEQTPIRTSLPISTVSNIEGHQSLKEDLAIAIPRKFQIPQARAGRKISPNLVVDIAETCQEVFPFAAVADRHKVPLQKVFDTFSAIIQLPLLRNADDRRRHGSLGKRRVKEYRDAKRAMEKAHEAERKAQITAVRARVEEVSRKGKSTSTSGL